MQDGADRGDIAGLGVDRVNAITGVKSDRIAGVDAQVEVLRLLGKGVHQVSAPCLEMTLLGQAK